MSDQNPKIRAFTGTITGLVQGVGFRYFTQNKAKELNITGWVRNLSDGSVEVTASGPLLDLEQFMHCLEAGPVGSRVEKVAFQWLDQAPAFQGFEIWG